MASKRNKRRKASRLSLIKEIAEKVQSPGPKKMKLSKAERQRIKEAARINKMLQEGEDWLNYMDWLMRQRQVVTFH